MKRTININGKEIEFESNGALSIIYARLFQNEKYCDLMKDMNSIEKDESGAETIINQLAYAMYVTALHGKEKVDYIEWLSQFEFMELVNYTEEIIGLWTLDAKTNVAPKKNKER